MVEAPSRWVALDLARRLERRRWYLIEIDESRWDVHVEAPGEGIPNEVESWAREHGLEPRVLA
jgi:hypothetical protein